MNDRGDIPDHRDLEEKAQDLAERALASDATAGDAAAMYAFGRLSAAHARAVAEAIELHSRLRSACDALKSDPDIVARTAWAKTWHEPPARRAIGRRAFLTGAVAASAAGLVMAYSPLGLWPSLEEMRADYRTGAGERRTVAIAQGLQVELNTRTAFARRPDDMAYRLRLIAGEVAVDAHGLPRPVLVETSHGRASTRDGQFSARLLDKGLCITCVAGAVTVQAAQQAALRLVRGQQTVLDGDATPAIVSVDPEMTSAWRRGALIFNGQPLAEVVGELNRYWSGRIVLTNSALGSRKVNGIFQLDRLANAPVQIGNLTRARVTNLPGGIVLLS
ncbi:FecR domain-containing protein [Sphingomonas sp. MMSM24]|uniref:FecR domain-containing protein n=2 Tax=Sphingomonas lycopersici TaxID=2951807 RepID=A0AA42CNT2_9SPHN|nr:FecR domain-containing protein [Sphingomonas lycopersici]